MPLEELGAIDMILAPNEEGKIPLVVTDSGLTTDPHERLELLVQKLSRYMGAILSGELNEDGVERSPGDYCIRVVCANRPTNQMSAITQISPEGDTSVSVKVEFQEYPEGAWEGTPEPEEEMDNSAEGLVQIAFEAGEQWLKEGNPPLFILYLEGRQRTLSPLENVSSHDEVMAKLTTWGRESAQNVSICVLMGMSHIEHEGESFPALVAQVYERGAENSLILGWRLKESDGPTTAVGAVFALGSGENILV